MCRYTGCLALIAGLLVAQLVSAAPHPFHDDGGAVNWRPSWRAALETAQRSGKPILVEATVEGCPLSKQIAATTLRDARVSQLINRYFVPVVIESSKPPPELLPLFQQAQGKELPFFIYLTDKGQTLHSTHGDRKPNDLEADMSKVLENKLYVIPKNREAALSKQVEALGKTLDGKEYAKAAPIFQAINKVAGYSATKDKAFDLMDAAQKDGTEALANAVNQARKDEFAEAKKAVAGVAKQFAGLPVADEAKTHAAALKVLDQVNQLEKAKKGNWKPAAVQYLDQLIRQFPDSPYVALATEKKAELLRK